MRTVDTARYENEQKFFDNVAAESPVTRMDLTTLERYAKPKHPRLFSKEKMFSLLGDAHGKRVLEIGCGEGVASVQLGYCGAKVTGVDISPVSIERARQRAAIHEIDAEFLVANAETDDLGEDQYDVVWCDLILHHLVGSLDAVMEKLKRALRPGGVWIAREPIAYASWLKSIRRLVPVKVPYTDDEQPFRDSEFAAVERHFPNLECQHYRLLARADRVTADLNLIAFLANIDRVLLKVHAFRSLAGNVVMWGTKG